jgi:GntR family transcriptional repressor for pyruvate dehydrogenase complex
VKRQGADLQRGAEIESFALVPGRRQRLGDQLYGQILDQILSGRLKEGDRLPPETEICDMFGVSRPIVREALIRLRADGLVQARQGAGTFVMHRPASRLASFADTQDIAAMLRCIEVRMPLEGSAARLAAERRTAEQLARIVAAHDAFEHEAEGGGMSPATDLAFHASVAAATGNEVFAELLHKLHVVLDGFMTLSLALTRTGSKDRISQVVHEHRQVLEAIRAQDAEAAGIAMQFHIGQARRRMVDGSRDK